MRFDELSGGAKGSLVLLVIATGAIILLLGSQLAARLGEYLELRAHPEVSERIEDTIEAIGDGELYTLEFSPDDLKNFPLPFTRADGRLVHVPAYRHELDYMPPPSHPAPEGVTRVAFVGGSTTMGYPRFTSRALNEMGHRVEIHNIAAPGSISGTSLLFMKRYLGRWKPDLVVVYHGFNDVNFIASHDAYAPITSESNRSRAFAQLREYYESMLAFCTDRGCELVVSTFAGPDLTIANADERQRYEVLFREIFPWIGTPAHYADLLAEYNAMIRRFAAERRVDLIDVAASHPSAPSFFRDECHRTDEGVAAHGQIAASALSSILLRRGAPSAD